MSTMIQLATNIEDMSEYEPLPSGTYNAEVREVEVKHSEKQPGGYFVIKMMVDPNDYPVDYDPANAPEGVLLTYARVSVPDPANRRTVAPFKALLKSLGVTVQGGEFDPQDWVGKTAQVIVSTSVYQGSPTNNVEAIQPVPAI